MVSAMGTEPTRRRRATSAGGHGFPFSGDLDENIAMIIPDVLALDFDGVLCDGMREYFETSRRTYAKAVARGARAWRGSPARVSPAPAVILSGWEMPLLVRAIILERPEAGILADWAAVRDEVAASSPRHGDALIELLKTTLDQVRVTGSPATAAAGSR
jgi:hypothetical protein